MKTGSRNKLSEAFIRDLQSLWTEEGPEILRRVAREKPDKLVQAMVQVLPRDFQVTVDREQARFVLNAGPPLSVEEWKAKHGIGDKGLLIEHKTDDSKS